MVTMVKVPTMVTIKKAAELTGLSYNCLRNLCINEKIIYINAGTKYLINLEKLVEYLNGQRKGKDNEAVL